MNMICLDHEGWRNRRSLFYNDHRIKEKVDSETLLSFFISNICLLTISIACTHHISSKLNTHEKKILCAYNAKIG